MVLRISEVASSLGISRRALERERAAGRFPPPDRIVGRMPLWRVQTIERWLGGDDR
jgi:predicted DNA-binding transcriptional regulator AlpA